MGFIDKLKNLVGGNTDKAKEGIDQAADVVDEKTGGKHSDKIDEGAETAKDYVDDIDAD